MKTEDSPKTPIPSQPATPVPPPQSFTAQWPSTTMAIDPALQQQSTQHPTTTPAYYSPYTSHYPQAAYATHYQTYAPPVSAQPTASQQQARQTANSYQTSTYSLGTTGNNAANSSGAAGNANTMDTADIATLNDALGSAGVDLRAEEESLQRSSETHQSYRPYEDRTRKQPPKPSFDSRILGTTMRTIGTAHKITRIPEESVNYLALSLRARLQDLITAMIEAANHRTDTTFDRPATLYEDGSPMWSIIVRSDIAKQLAVLEKVEREEETRLRKERKERAEMTAAHAAALAAQAIGAPGGVGAAGTGGGGDGDEAEGSVKKKRKKEGPGVTARNMSEDVRKKMSNAVATQAAGLGGKYSWMTAANTSTPAPKPKPAAATSASILGVSGSTTGTPAASSTGNSNSGAGSTWARPYVSVKKPSPGATGKETPTEDDSRTMVTMRDAMFVIEKERGHGGGRGAARGWV